ncbi:MAG: Rpn family recombination-promoting nuclease/putative transposase [Chitinispirillales bacterium]|jgi:predicted transposase/invertase (TIGR01784 family)|nr:Rpn family recombination-promoting nuclease/putative transposase [Chitinispirillales bacterium]
MAKLLKDADILPPSDDHIFKTLLTHPDAEHVLVDIISAVIERTVISVQIRNTELPATYTEEKAERLDVNCVIDNGDQVNVEMHSSRIVEPVGNHKNFTNKYIYYGTDLHSSQTSKGKKYFEFARTYQITFCSYTVLPNRRDYVNRAALRFPDGELLSDQINLIIVEMSKLGDVLKKPVEELTSLESWSIFLGYAPDKNYRDYINHIIESKKEVDMAATLLQKISKDEQARARYRSRKMFETDIESNLLTAVDNAKEEAWQGGRQEGRQEGWQVGIEEERRKNAKAMKAEGIDVNTIIKITGLTADDIQKL